MSVSRREVLIGTAAVLAIGTNVSGMAHVAAATRPPLTPIGCIFVTLTNCRARPMISDAWHRDFVPSLDAPLSQQQQCAGLLNIYWALSEGAAIDVRDLMCLDHSRWYQLVSLGFHYNNAAYRPDDRLPVCRPSRAHDRAVCEWVDRELSQIVDDGWRFVPSAFATHRRASLALFERAFDLQDCGKIDEALTVCDETIERYGIEDEAGERSLYAKFFWLREAGRIEESKIVWDRIWRCIADVPGYVWGFAWHRDGATIRRAVSYEDLRAAAAVPEIDISLGTTPNARYRKLTSKLA
jgi:hypothetical protein